MLKKWIAKSALITLSAMLINAPAAAAPGWTTPLTIETLIPAEEGLIITVTGNNNPTSCAQPAWLRLKTTNPNYQMIASSILTAFSQGKPIKVWQTSCDSDGYAHFIAAWIDR